MPIENDFLPFAAAGGANVVSQSAYAALSALALGFVDGTADPTQCNKVWRQSSLIAAVLAQFIVDHSGQPAIDDGTTATLEANLLAAVQAIAQAKLGNYAGYLAAPGTYNIVAADMGKTIAVAAPGFTLALPAAASVPAGSSVRITPSTSGTLGVSGGDVMIVGASVGDGITNGVTSLKLNGGDATAVSDGSSRWSVSGSNTLANCGGFSFSLAGVNGYQVLPSGLIIQWGSVNQLQNTSATYSFPIAFPVGPKQLVASKGFPAGNAGETAIGAGAISTTQFSINNTGSQGLTQSIHWIAVGN